MGRREQQREETRRRLLDVARAQFAARGFEATQLRDIAKEAGVALGTIFAIAAVVMALSPLPLRGFGR